MSDAATHTASESKGTRSSTPKTRARLPSKRKSFGNIVRNDSTRFVWQLKYIATCCGTLAFQSMRTVLPARLGVTNAGSPHFSVSSSSPTSGCDFAVASTSSRSASSFFRTAGG